MTDVLTPNEWILRRGSPQPPPERIELRAGALTMLFEPDLAFLRYVRLGDRELLRGVYAAVRDRDWGTVTPRISELHVDRSESSFRISFDVACREREIDFRWHGELTGAADGTVTYTLEGRAHSSFLTNRIGFCVLHPDMVAGEPCVVEHTDGSREEGAFPAQISPHQPFFDIRAITHVPAPGTTFEVRMEGDTFEMEDQRNWTDASYKTYCTPLALPYPVEVNEGATVRHRITLMVRGAGAGESRTRQKPFELEVSPPVGRPLPRMGLCLATDQPALSAAQIDRLRALKLSHLRIDLRLGTESALPCLDQALQLAGELGTGLEIALFASDRTQSEFAQVTGDERLRNLPGLTWLVFPVAGKATTEAEIALARQHIEHGRIIVGTDAYFTELNRLRPQAAGLGGVCYSVNPQVHAFDDASLVETLATQGTTVESAQKLYPGQEVIVSPVTLKPRSNPDATSAVDSGAAEDPGNVDPRQSSLFAAGWTLGSWKYLAEAGASSITWFETHGPRGVLAATTDDVFPPYHVLCAVADLSDGELVSVRSSDPLRVIAAMVRGESRTSLLVANLSPNRAGAMPPIPNEATAITCRRLDDASARAAAGAPESFFTRREPWIPPADGVLPLAPYSLVCLEWESRVD